MVPRLRSAHAPGAQDVVRAGGPRRARVRQLLGRVPGSDGSADRHSSGDSR